MVLLVFPGTVSLLQRALGWKKNILHSLWHWTGYSLILDLSILICKHMGLWRLDKGICSTNIYWTPAISKTVYLILEMKRYRDINLIFNDFIEVKEEIKIKTRIKTPPALLKNGSRFKVQCDYTEGCDLFSLGQSRKKSWLIIWVESLRMMWVFWRHIA